MVTLEKPIAFRGSALGDLKAFPVGAKREAGFQLSMVQMGHDPVDWKPMSSIGSGVREIRIREAEGVFRVIYIAKLEAAIYVLHCFQKKTQATSQKDIALASQRYRDLIKEFER